MNKSDFHENTRYTLTWIDENGKARPGNIYVMKLHDDGMIVRFTEKAAVLKKLAYENVVRVIKTTKVAEKDRFYIPDAVLAEAHWKDRSELFHYSSAPHVGK